LIIFEKIHIQNDIKNNLNIVSSPIPALIVANIEVGNGGCIRVC
jgi:hypothetical protein